MQAAVDALHPYTGELFIRTDAMNQCIEDGTLSMSEAIASQWQATIDEVFAQAMLQTPDVPWPQIGGRDGLHTEDFGYLLTELQYMQRAYPGAQW
jgi:ring-1,2-phenylacetyl-CoA epoxidase subunit PaaC